MPHSDDDFSISSSSDDGAGFESPDDDSDQEDINNKHHNAINPFKFKAKAFGRKVTSPRKRPIADASSELEQRLEQMERRKKARQSKVTKKTTSLDLDDDDEDDSDLDDDLGGTKQGKKSASADQKQPPPQQQSLKPSNSNKQNQEVIELLDDSDDNNNKKPAATTRTARATRSRASPARNTRAAKAAAKSAAASSATDLTGLSSDDDSDYEGGALSRAHDRRNNPLPNAAAEALRRAQVAKSRLKQAQHYHANDVFVKVDEPELPQRFRSGSTSNTEQLSGMAKASLPLGKAFKVTCCTQLKIKGVDRPSQDESFTVRENEPLQVLFDNYIKALRLPKTAKVTMTYKNQTLTKQGTPKSFKLTSRARIQCTAEAAFTVGANAVSPSAAIFKSKKALGKPLQLKCQVHIKFKDPKKKTKPLTSVLEIRELEQLSMLLAPVRKAHNIPANLKLTMSFDGEACENETPKSYDMESEDIVEFTVKDVVKLWYSEKK